MPRLIEISKNFHRLELGRYLFWFSYAICVAFQADTVWIKSENVWSNTTAKHLGQLTAEEVSHEEFRERLIDVIKGML